MSLLSAPLQAFVRVVACRTVHGAAAELGLTQTAVTQRIRVLESQLGVTLFLRSRKGMTLTREGEAILRYCQGAQQLEGFVSSQIRGGAKEQDVTLTIAGPTSVLTARVVSHCLGLYNRWPHLQLNLMTDDSPNLVSRVQSGQCDLAIISPEQVPNEMDSKQLKPERYLLLGSRKWKGRALKQILSEERIIDFYESDNTTTNYLKSYSLLSYVKRPRIFANNNATLIQLLITGAGFGTLTQEIAKPQIEADTLLALNNGSFAENPLALVWYPRPIMPKYFEDVVRTIK
jgi:LysR family transcriptional regulator (chromosome initiation inhibitor)